MKNAQSFNFREQEQNPLCIGFEIYVFFRRVNAQFSQNIFEPQHIWREDSQQLQMFLWIWAAKQSVIDSNLWTWEQSTELL